MSFVQAILHAQDFENGDILEGIPGTITDVDIGGGDFAEAGIAITGMGQAGIYGLFGSDCVCTDGGTTPVGPEDPPVIYTFSNATSPYGREHLNLNLKMIRANDYAFNVQVVLNGATVNLTGGELRFTAKWNVNDTDGDELFSVFTPNDGIAFIDETLGTATITIASELTDVVAVPYHRIDLPYDLTYIDSSGKIHTVMYGTLTILPNVTRTFS